MTISFAMDEEKYFEGESEMRVLTCTCGRCRMHIHRRTPLPLSNARYKCLRSWLASAFNAAPKHFGGSVQNADNITSKILPTQPSSSAHQVDNEFSSNSFRVQENTGRRHIPSDSYPGAYTDFYGIPSNPRCVFKTGNTWFVPRGPEAQRILREARPVCDHPMGEMWLDLGKHVYEFLDSLNVKWTSIDPVRFAPVRYTEKGEDQVSCLHLWVGVMPGTLSLEDAKAAAKGCKGILDQAGFPEIEIAFRHSIITRSAGPRLLELNSSPINLHPDVSSLRSPFTPILGVQIAPLKTPYYEGTGAVFIRENSESERVFLLTARHVVLPPSQYPNKPHSYTNSSQRREEVIILGFKAYHNATKRLESTIVNQELSIEIHKRMLHSLQVAGEVEPHDQTTERDQYKSAVATAEQTIKNVKKVQEEVTKNWMTPTQRILGYILHAPPIGVNVGPNHFTQDWALVDIDRDKVNWSTFPGNQIYLGHEISPSDFVLKMHPHSEGQSSFHPSFHHLARGVLQIKGIVKDDEIRKPKQLDVNGEKCLFVVKNGMGTGVTYGRATGMESFVREYNDYGTKKTSTELAVYSYSNKDGAFSASGDSGSIVVDGEGRIVGLLTGGSGSTESTDATYLTPYWWIDEQIKKQFPHSFLYDIVDA
ncbi:hypothetical protein D9758_010100 [Tetrapyrgos nigripes]|uniref:Uncharacterized protein n=1 Tax=Tetrapyrgos nigripes TaxID=182062 RepID=A0A8H5CSU9_9AGAR|nr:hypothetical protein D9758_010100 [Tetrapyrgos nigripes]